MGGGRPRAEFLSTARPRLRRVLIGMLSLGLALLPPLAWPDLDRAARVKAAYIYNFLLFVRWPEARAEGPIRLCTLGAPVIHEALGPITEKRIEGRPIVLQRVATAAAARPCQILFIGAAEEPRLQQILSDLEDVPVLTTSDIPEFALRGGIIGFVYRERRARLEIDLERARAAGLAISSSLLEVAVRVYRNGEVWP